MTKDAAEREFNEDVVWDLVKQFPLIANGDTARYLGLQTEVLVVTEIMEGADLDPSHLAVVSALATVVGTKSHL